MISVTGQLSGLVMGVFMFASTLARGIQMKASWSFTLIFSLVIGVFSFCFYGTGDVKKVGLTLFLMPFVGLGALLGGSALNREVRGVSQRAGRVFAGVVCGLIPCLMVFRFEHLTSASALVLSLLAFAALLAGALGPMEKPPALQRNPFWRWLAEGFTAYSKPGGIRISMSQSSSGGSGSTSPGSGGRSGGAGSSGNF